VHALRELGLFTDAEWVLLERASNDRWRRQYDIDGRYVGRPESERIEEGIANAYAEWKEGRHQSDGRLNRLFQRIDNFAALRLAVRKAFGGSATVKDIFSAIERGEVGRRQRGERLASKGIRPEEGVAPRTHETDDSGPNGAASDSGPRFALSPQEQAVLDRVVASDEKAARKATFNDIYTAAKDDLNPIRVLRNELAEGRLLPLQGRNPHGRPGGRGGVSERPAYRRCGHRRGASPVQEARPN
jgi:hypothetical protein